MNEVIAFGFLLWTIPFIRFIYLDKGALDDE
jgi:hypothetical protein